MSIFRSIVRYITTLGGLISSRVDEGTDALVSTPQGIKAAFRQTRSQWTKQYQEVRDAVSQLMMVMEQKRQEINKLEKEREQVEIKKRGAVNKFKETKEEKYQKAFQDTHLRANEIDQRLETLNSEVEKLEEQVDGYKERLQEMQTHISNLDKQEAEAIADIVSSKQIVELNDRLANVSTSLNDENIHAIRKAQERSKAKAKLSDELAGVETANVEKEIMAAGMSTDAMDEFNKMLVESELKDKERGQGAGPEIERTM